MNQGDEFLREGERVALATAARLFHEVVRDLIRFVVRLLPALIRFGCVAVCAVGVTYGTYDAWQAFGGDVPALVPALALGLIPLLFAFISRVSFGGMIAAGGFTYLAAQGLLLLPSLLRQISILVVLATLTFTEMSRRGQPDNSQHEHSTKA